MTNTKSDSAPKLRAASAGKRLLALVVDFAFSLLLVNTILQLSKPQHWDLLPPSDTWSDYLPYHLALGLMLLLKDLPKYGSPGKFALGIGLRSLTDMQKAPAVPLRVARNLFYLVFPLDVYFMSRDSFLRRLGDLYTKTVVVENPESLRPMLRLLFVNFLFFAYFFSAMFLQPTSMRNSAAYQIALDHVNHSPTVRQAVGTILEVGDPQIRLDVNPQFGEAVLTFEVEGEQATRDVRVALKLVTEPERDWAISSTRILDASENEDSFEP